MLNPPDMSETNFPNLVAPTKTEVNPQHKADVNKNIFMPRVVVTKTVLSDSTEDGATNNSNVQEELTNEEDVDEEMDITTPQTSDLEDFTGDETDKVKFVKPKEPAGAKNRKRGRPPKDGGSVSSGEKVIPPKGRSGLRSRSGSPRSQ